MEVSFNKLRQKCVICVTDGKNLGKVCDVIFCYPENNINGFYVTGSKGFKLTRQDIFIPIQNITKIGEDAILTNFSGEDNPPQNERPPKKAKHCPPPNCCQQNNNCPPPSCRGFDEYE